MAILKCKMCGGDILLSEDKTTGTCDHCGSIMTFPRVSDEQKLNLYNRANHFRRQNEFDKAITAYHDVGYVFELAEKEQKNIIDNIKQHNTIEQFIVDLQNEINEDNILHKLEEETRIQKIDINFPNNSVQIDSNAYYSEELIKNYFVYRAVRFGVIDHGIAGGVLMHNKLLHIYDD